MVSIVELVRHLCNSIAPYIYSILHLPICSKYAILKSIIHLIPATSLKLHRYNTKDSLTEYYSIFDKFLSTCLNNLLRF